jgi:hypothetical protein
MDEDCEDIGDVISLRVEGYGLSSLGFRSLGFRSLEVKSLLLELLKKTESQATQTKP